MRADRDHTLCFECFRRERDRQRARNGSAQRRLPFDTTMSAVQAVTTAAPVLSARQVEHRQAMLAHLTGYARRS